MMIDSHAMTTMENNELRRRLQEVRAENEMLVHAGQELRRACEHKNKIIDNMQDAIERLREDSVRLEWLLRKLPGDALRYCVGELADTADANEFRAKIDAALNTKPEPPPSRRIKEWRYK